MDHTISPTNKALPTGRILLIIGASLSAGLGGLALSRLLFEGFFPRATWLGQPIGAITLMLIVAMGGLIFWFWLSGRVENPSMALTPFLPLWLNLFYLPSPGVDLTLSRVLFGGSLWFSGVILHRLFFGKRGLVGWLFVGLLPVYLLTMSHAVGTADTFEFQVVIPRLGVVHPTGYPLYMLLGRLFTFLPLDSVAWRLNLASVGFALAAVSMVYFLLLKLTGRAIPSLLAAFILGLMPTFWSQAIQAEVYALHALFVASTLYLMSDLLSPSDSRSLSAPNASVLLALVLGLGLTHHLTTVFLLPPAGLTLFMNWRQNRPARRTLIWMVVAFILPLLLYAYLPIRWAAVNGEPMGISRFFDWIAGRRFQGALRLGAWLQDTSRYGILVRLFLAEWVSWPLLLFIPLGILASWRRQWRILLVLIITWLGFTFYSLNYYVADLAVFLLPANLVMVVIWGVGLSWLATQIENTGRTWSQLLTGLLLTLVLAPVLIHTGEVHWRDQDRSKDDGQTTWAAAVLASNLSPEATILADSVKFPPLYYLQQAEDIRPDLDIMILPDEAAYLAELTSRIANEQTVYLARFLPGLAGSYHLRSAGPLTEVSTAPLTELPAGITPANLNIADLQLSGFTLQPVADHDPDATALTLYWQTTQADIEPLHIYLRWMGENGPGDIIPPAGQHPVHNNYPTPAWDLDEVVPDFHLLPRPVVPETKPFTLQVAVAPPFTNSANLTWHNLTTVNVEPLSNPQTNQVLRTQLGPISLSGSNVARQIRPGTDLQFQFTGYGSSPEELVFVLRPAEQAIPDVQSIQTDPIIPAAPAESFTYANTVSTNVPSGRYALYGLHPTAPARCGWLSTRHEGCVIDEIDIAGVPLPADAVNFDDQVALLDIDLANAELQPGGRLLVTINWLSLSTMDEDYTVFVQLLDDQDQIVGQVDSWPLQGTYPTSQWPAGEIVTDPYEVQLPGDLKSGSYRLAVGWYLLETLQRLPVVDEAGNPIDDRFILTGLYAP